MEGSRKGRGGCKGPEAGGMGGPSGPPGSCSLPGQESARPPASPRRLLRSAFSLGGGGGSSTFGEPGGSGKLTSPLTPSPDRGALAAMREQLKG